MLYASISSEADILRMIPQNSKGKPESRYEIAQPEKPEKTHIQITHKVQAPSTKQLKKGT
jgi:hypothetical protein